MTDKTSEVNKDSNTQIESLAADYLESLKQEVDEEGVEELEEQISDREERRDCLADEHGENHHLVQKASEAIRDLEGEREEIQNTTRAIDDRRKELLEAVDDDPGFEFNKQWLKPEVIRAVTHALYGIEDTEFTVQNHIIESVSDVSDVNDFDQIEMEHIIVSLARDKIDVNKTVQNRWDRLSDSVALPALKVLDENGPMAPKDVASELDDDSTTIKNRLKNFIHSDQFIPLYRPEKGVYGLSTTGKYLLANYADSPGPTRPESEKSPEEGNSETSDKSDTQSQVAEGKQNNDQATETAKQDDGENEGEESTEDKAEQMFADIGDYGGEGE